MNMIKGNFQTESADELYCEDKAFVIRNRALAQRYPGGASAFFEKFMPDQLNEEISVFYGPVQKKLWDCLLDRGFIHNKDFLVVDIDLFNLGDNTWPYPPTPEVTWLKGRRENHAVFLSFIEDKPASEQSEIGLPPGFNSPSGSTEGHETSQTL
jgi:hypothetical protein